MTAPTRPRRVVPATPALEARAKADRSARRSRALRRISNALVVLLPLAALSWVLLASTWLGVERIAVTGAVRVSQEQVVQAAAVPAGTPLARVDTGAVEQRVSRLAPVADVAVRRTWPGTLTVEVTERSAVAAVPRAGRVTLVDAQGVPFATESAVPKGLIRLQVDRPGPDDAATRAGLEVYAALPEALRQRVGIVSAPSPAAVTLHFYDGRKVVWGRPGGTETKAAAVAVLIQKPGSVFDVSAGDVVVVR